MKKFHDFIKDETVRNVFENFMWAILILVGILTSGFGGIFFWISK